MKIFYFFLSINYIFSINFKEIPFPNDTKCEQLGSEIIKYFLSNYPIKNNSNIINSNYIQSDLETQEKFFQAIKNSGFALNDLGDYYQCNSLSFTSYYLLNLKIDLNSAKIGICYFKDCSFEYFQNFSMKLINILNEYFSLNLTSENLNIEQPEKTLSNFKEKYKFGMYFSIIFLLIPLVICIIITIKNQKNKFLSAFNLQKNAKKILNISNQNNTISHMRIFDGVRVIACWFVIFGHTCYFPLNMNGKNALEFFFMVKRTSFNLITSSYYAVDVFFYLSGFLVYFSMQKYLNNYKIKKFQTILIAFILRYLRLFPFLFVFSILITYILPHLSNNINYYSIENYIDSCPKKFWHNFLYIQNFMNYNGHFMCGLHSWYLATDMQFFLYSVFVIILFNNHKFIRWSIFISTFFICNALQFYEVIKNHYNFNDMIHPGYDTNKQTYKFYIRPHIRIPPYLIGIFHCELFLNTKMYLNDNPKKKKIKNNKNYSNLNINNDSLNNSKRESLISHSNEENFLDSNFNNNFLYKINNNIEQNNFYCAWIILIISLFFMNLTFWTSAISNKHQLSDFWSAMNNVFGRLLFISGLAGILHLTFLDKFKIFNLILAQPIQTIIARNTYGIYILHLYFLVYFLCAHENFYYVKMIDLFFLSIGIYALSWIGSFIIGLIMESPIIVISKFAISNNNSKKKNNKE